MSFGRNRNSTDIAQQAIADFADLFAQCERVFADSSGMVMPDDSCADYRLDLVSPDGGDTYVLTVSNDGRSYGLFPLGKYAGHGSFIKPDGGFLQHGRIAAADAWLILTTFTPAAGQL